MEQQGTKQFYSLGTFIGLNLWGRDVEAAIEETVTKLSEIDDKMSAYKKDSEISKINLLAGQGFCQVSKDTFTVIKKSMEFSQLTKGAFDATIRPIVQLWGIGTDTARIPTEEEITKTLQLVNWHDIELDEAMCSIGLKHPMQTIDLGGIAKGFAADVVKEIFEKHEVSRAIINLGGNIFVLGTKDDGSLWNVGIQHPLFERDTAIGLLSTTNTSIVTSGGYERFLEKDGKIYHHIIDPKTGKPSDAGLMSTTIISNTSIEGDALATSVYIMGLTKGRKLIESLPGVEAIFVMENREVVVTTGLENNFALTDEEFTWI